MRISFKKEPLLQLSKMPFKLRIRTEKQLVEISQIEYKPVVFCIKISITEVRMTDKISRRVIAHALYIIEKKTTVREVAKVFDISKSTVHADLTKRLKFIDESLWKEVKKVLEINLSERHLRGGESTKNKYLSVKKRD